MRIYLDSKDHIILTERFSAEENKAFKEALLHGSHELVFSMNNIMECCAPLIQISNNNSVMQSLNLLENMPHLYIAETSIQALELKEAINAFFKAKEYKTIDPFVTRFDEVVSPFTPPLTRDYIDYSLAHIIFDLWQVEPGLFSNPHKLQSTKIKTSRNSDRQRINYRRHDLNFPNTIIKDLKLFNIAFPQELVNDFASWIWASPNRCPAMRLTYEVYHKILKNLTDNGENSDIPDFAHINCLPYVDGITLDRRIRGYIRQVDQSLGTQYSKRIYKDIQAVKALLN